MTRQKVAGCIRIALCCALISACSHKETIEPSPYHTGNGVSDLKIGKPYIVEGRTYVPAYNPTYVEVGTASWYGPGFHGRKTANGDRFNENALTAAHRTLPLPCLVKVTNLNNGKSAVLEVNDRGPFRKDRILDLSKASAKTLGVYQTGTAQVQVEYLHQPTRSLILSLIRQGKLNARPDDLAAIDMDNTLQETASNEAGSKSVAFGLINSADAAEPDLSMSRVRVDDTPPLVNHTLEILPVSAPVRAMDPGIHVNQKFIKIASLTNKTSADNLVQRLGKVATAYVKPVEINGQVWYRVRLGPLADNMEAEDALRKVRGMGFSDAHIIND